MDHLALPVRDQERSRGLYETYFGVAVEVTAVGPPRAAGERDPGERAREGSALAGVWVGDIRARRESHRPMPYEAEG
jgi:catechol 2,3-dioxygenase-like lactoylglutathione lyase family enzyme